MRPTLTRTLFASFLALTLLLLLATLGLARWSFERGFYEYVKTLDRYRLEGIAVDLVALYGEQGRSWSALDEEVFAWFVRRHMPGPPMPDIPPLPLPMAPDVTLDTALNAASNSVADEAPYTARNAAINVPPPGMLLANGRALQRGPATALFDTHGQQLAGQRLRFDDADHVIVPVMFEGEAVAELQATVRRQIESPAETVLAQQQTRASVLIGATALALAAIISWLLARTFLAPVEASIASVARLSDGDYSPRERQTESALNQTIAHRGDELGRLASDIERLRQTLASARSARRRLLADVSHELRTPLTILGGEIAAMKDGLRPLDAVQLASIDQEVERLKALVEDLYELSISDVGGLRYEFVSMDVQECLVRAIDSIRYAASDAGIDIEIDHTSDGQVELEGDARRLAQLFTNLLSNSIAYTDAPGRICIAITSSAHEVHIVLEDTPPGVRTDSYENLFESLYRDDHSRSRRPGGAGLGLAICRNIVEAHGGRISASRSERGGLRVDVVLPRKIRDRQ